MAEGGEPSRPWFNDRRFNFATNPSRIRHNFSQIVNELNNVAAEHPELLTQMTQHIHVLSELVRQNSGTTEPTGDVPSAVVVDMDNSQNNENVDVADDSILANEEAGVPGDPIANNANEPTGQQQATNNIRLNEDWQRLVQLLQSPELRQIAAAVLGITPFLLIILIKLFVSHLGGFITVSVAISVFIWSNVLLNKTVSNRTNIKWSWLIKSSLAMTLWLFAVYILFEDEHLWKTFIFLWPTILSETKQITSVIWIILVADFTAKFAGMLVKCLVAASPIWLLAQQKTKRRLYQWLEYTNQMYRHWLPVPVWYYYLSAESGSNWFSWTICFILNMSYFLIKMVYWRAKLVNWFYSTYALWNPAGYGTRPSKTKMASIGPTCSICFVEYSKPISLICGHIFCEECISTWLDKERTCPICRAEVIQEDNSWKCGSTSWLVQLF